MSRPLSRARLLDWLYPPLCALCQEPLRDGCHLCSLCRARLHSLPSSACRKCAHCFDGDISPPTSCPNCEDLAFSFDFATAALRSCERSLELVHQFKLQSRPELGKDLAGLVARAYREDGRFQQRPEPLLIPVPLHPARQRQRRFNQAVEIASPLARELDLEMRQVLKRVQDTARQAVLTRAQRRNNLRKAIQLRIRPEALTGRHLVLIDDVFTTGSTAQACARALRKAKPASIAVLTVVRA